MASPRNGVCPVLGLLCLMTVTATASVYTKSVGVPETASAHLGPPVKKAEELEGLIGAQRQHPGLTLALPDIDLLKEVKASGNIIAGAGYSADSQQIGPQICYNATISSTSGQQGYIQLDTATSFSDLESKLGLSVSIRGKFPMFSVDAESSYMRSLQDKDYSLSLNYYEYATNKVAIKLAGTGDKALTVSGKAFYNGGKNPYFGLLCGDNYIASYDQGALLVMGLNIKFSSSNAKRVFEAKAGATFGDIIHATASVKNVVSQYQITGSVVMQAFQIGGDPSQLSKVLNKDSSGNYYALECSLTAMDSCIKAASGLLDYAKDDFSKQFSFENNTGLTPLGIGFSQYFSIEYIGLTPPPSLVTHEVEQYRNELSDMLKESEYYQQKFYPFFNLGYPVELDVVFINNVNPILSKANSNVHILMRAHEGAADCFNFPDKCKSIKDNIVYQLQNITISDLKFVEEIKYIVGTQGGEFFNTGGGLATSWIVIPETIYPIRDVSSVSITDKQYSFLVNLVCGAIYVYNGTSNDNLTYVGTLCEHWKHCWYNRVYGKRISPFFFEAYNSSTALNGAMDYHQSINYQVFTI